jgi:uncharacterized protein HemX
MCTLLKNHEHTMKSISSKPIATTALCCALIILAIPTSSSAGERWRENHARRAEVNQRLGNQNQRINQERREGEINQRQAAQMHQQDRQIRREERLMAQQNGGHINRQEQRVLNQQENQVSREIGR